MLTDLFGSIYTLRRDFIVGYFFHMAMANRGCTLGIATNAFNLQEKGDHCVAYGSVENYATPFMNVT